MYDEAQKLLLVLLLAKLDRLGIQMLIAIFQVMVHLVDGVLPENYFANNLQGLSVDMAVFRDLMKARLQQLSKHLDALQKEANKVSTGEAALKFLIILDLPSIAEDISLFQD